MIVFKDGTEGADEKYFIQLYLKLQVLLLNLAWPAYLSHNDVRNNTICTIPLRVTCGMTTLGSSHTTLVEDEQYPAFVAVPITSEEFESGASC